MFDMLVKVYAVELKQQSIHFIHKIEFVTN